jgi:RNA polymerase sigma-70 factor, ECF subfamily
MNDLEQQLQEHARCVRSLAAALLRDEAAGQDIAQETMLVACQRGPRTSQALRSWMLRVGRRLANRRRHSERRRSHREDIASLADDLPSASDDVVRTEMLQAVAAAIAALPATLREVVLLRYYDDLPPRVVAARLALSSEAVESRLRRAREHLRATLRAHAPEDGFRKSMLLLAGPGAWLPTKGIAVVTTQSKTLLTSSVLLLLLLSAVAIWWHDTPATASPSVVPVATAQPTERAAISDQEPERVDAATSEVGETSQPRRPSWTTQVTGRVVDEWRHPVEHAQILAQLDDGTRTEGLSDADGRFSLSIAVTNAWSCNGELLASKDTRAGTVPFSRWRNTGDVELDTIALSATGELRVQVCKGTAPIDNVRVVGVRAAMRPAMCYETTSDGTGAAVLSGLPPGRYCLGATAPDGSWIVGHADVLTGRPNHHVLNLLASTPVSVEVREHGTLQPIPAARIEAMYVIGSATLADKVPMHLVVPLPLTNEAGQAKLTGLCRGQDVSIGASHESWRPMVMWNARSIDWSQTPLNAQVQLEPLDTLTWRLVDGEVAVPPDGTMFTISETEVPLRDGCLHFDGQATQAGWSFTAIGPGCYAELQVPQAGSQPSPPSARLRGTRQLAVDLFDDRGQPLDDFTLSVWLKSRLVQSKTDHEGRAILKDLPSDRVTVHLESAPGLTMKELGEIDLRLGDGKLRATLAQPRKVRAKVYINNRPGLPGNLLVYGLEARVEQVEEDVDKGVLTFDLRLADPDQPEQLFLRGLPGLTMGQALVAPGSDRAEIEFRLNQTSGGTVSFNLPADGLCQVQVERFYAQSSGGKWGSEGRVDSTAPRRLSNLTPGRYRLHDTNSEVLGPEVEVTAGGPDIELSIDLSKVVIATGTVVANPPFDDTFIELRTQDGTVLRRKAVFPDGTFTVRASIDQPGLQLVAVRGAVASVPMPWSAAMSGISLVLPE